MRSALPKHLHPILGRRMVDWVLEAARPLEPAPLVVVASPRRRGVRRRRGRDPGAAAGHRRRGALGRGALAGAHEVLVLSGDTPLLTTALLSGLLDATGSGRRRDGALVRPGGRPQLRPDRPRRRRRPRLDRRGGRRHAGAAGIREANSSIYIFRADALWPALDTLTPVNAQGELYLTDAVRDIVDGGQRVGVHVAPDAAETEGVNTRVELAAAAAALRDRINIGHMLAGVTIVDPATTWIEPTVMLEPDAVVHPFTVLRGATTRRRGRRDRAPRGRGRRRDRSGARLVGPFCYLRPGTVLGAAVQGGHVRRDQEHAARRRHEGAAPLVHRRRGDRRRGRTSAPAAITANYPHQPAAEGADHDRERRQGRRRQCVRGAGRNRRRRMDGRGNGDNRRCPAGNALAGFPPRQVIKEGTRWTTGRLS